MKINAQKTQLIVLGSRQNLQRLPPVTVQFMGAAVTGSTSVRNLGVMFDQCMTFSSHVSDLVQRCTGLLCGLAHSRHCLPQSVLVTLVQGLVVSRIRYCISVYGVTSQTEIGRLQKLLNFAARVISGRRKFDHISDVLRNLNWLSSDGLYQYHALTLLHRILSSNMPESLAACLTTRRDIHQHCTRQSEQLVTPRIRTEAGRRRFLYSAVNTYNGLPVDLRALAPGRFKPAVRTYLLESQNGVT